MTTQPTVKDAVVMISMEMFDVQNPYVMVVGKFLTDHLTKNPQDVEKYMKAVDEKKTLSGSLLVMQEEARKTAVNNVAVLTDEQGFEIVLKYYGFIPGGEELAKPATPSKPKAVQPKASAVKKPVKAAVEQPKKDTRDEPDQISIFDLIEGESK